MRRPPAPFAFGQVTVKDAVVEIGGNAIGVNGNREMKRPAEAAVAALDPVVLLAVPLATHAGHGEPAIVVQRDREILAADSR
jgi:hypothetical protein